MTTDPRLDLWDQRKAEIERLTKYQHERRRTSRATSTQQLGDRLLDRLIATSEATIVDLEDRICTRAEKPCAPSP